MAGPVTMTGLLSICHLDPKPEASNSTPRSKDQQPLTSPPSDKTFWDLANSHNNPDPATTERYADAKPNAKLDIANRL